MPVSIRYGLLFLLAIFFVLMARITLQYIPVRTDAAFLLTKQAYIGITPWLIAFFIHVFTSMIPLAAGFTQFAPLSSPWRKKLHRMMGKCYIIVILFISGPASFLMALLANGGLYSRIAFTTLSLLWMYSTAQGWRTVKAGQYDQHRQWMYRSYALTLSAITLRSWKWLLVALFHLRPLDTYKLIAWLGFVPNLLLAEYLIALKNKKRLPEKQTASFL